MIRVIYNTLFLIFLIFIGDLIALEENGVAKESMSKSLYQSVSKVETESVNLEIKADAVIKIKEYIQEQEMSVSMYIGSTEGTLAIPDTIENEVHSPYAIHSIGKVFTGMLVLLMVKDGIISDDDLNKVPVQFDESVIEALPIQVRDQLKKVSLHELMTHKAGLGDYLGDYITAISEGKNLKMQIPDDFLQFAEDKVFPVGEEKYSNLGVLLVGLAIHHAYVKKHGDCEYNEILRKYIIDKVGMPSFSPWKPEQAKFNQSDHIAAHIDGSPAGGYWMTAEDLAKFGFWIYEQTQDDAEFELLMKKYGQEFYDIETRIVSHGGAIPSSSAFFSISLKTGRLVAILSDQQHTAFDLYRVVQENIF